MGNVLTLELKFCECRSLFVFCILRLAGNQFIPRATMSNLQTRLLFWLLCEFVFTALTFTHASIRNTTSLYDKIAFSKLNERGSKAMTSRFRQWNGLDVMVVQRAEQRCQRLRQQIVRVNSWTLRCPNRT